MGWAAHLSKTETPDTGEKEFKVDEVYVVRLGPFSAVIRIDAVDDTGKVNWEPLAGESESSSYPFQDDSVFARYCVLIQDSDGNPVKRSVTVTSSKAVCKCAPSHPHNERGCYYGMCSCRVGKTP